MFEQVLELADLYEAEICADLSREEKSSFVQLLLRMHARLTAKLVESEAEPTPRVAKLATSASSRSKL